MSLYSYTHSNSDKLQSSIYLNELPGLDILSGIIQSELLPFSFTPIIFVQASSTLSNTCIKT